MSKTKKKPKKKKKTKESRILTPKELASKYFMGDEKLCLDIKLTQEEQELLDKQAWTILYWRGLKNRNGGYSNINVIAGDQDELDLNVEFGIQCGNDEEDYSDNNTHMTFDRKTKTFKDS
jgi:hypothetical protein